MILLFALLSPGAFASDTWTRPLPWVELLTRVEGGADPQRIQVARVDLCEPGVHARATMYDERARTTSDWAEGVGASIAVNAAFFSYDDYDAIGWSIGDGETWPTAANYSGYTAVAFGSWARAELFADGTTFPVEGEDWWTDQVPGWPLIVWEGAAVDVACTSHLCEDHPRTAVGLSADGGTVLLAVVDGRSDIAAGMDMVELQELMLEMGAWKAMNLDGGGSSTLWIDGVGVVNDPSDGSERVVASHLGFVLDTSRDDGCCAYEAVDGATGTFADVPDGAWYQGYAEALYEAGITSGCQSDPLLFCPGCVLDRASLATLLARALGLTPVTDTASFGDVDPSAWYAGWVEALYQAGITSGCGDGNFCPDRLATRWEAAALVFRGMGIPEVTPEGLFSDVDPDDAGWLEALAAACVVSGCGDGEFCPDDEILRSEAAKLLAVAFSVGDYAPCDGGDTGSPDTGSSDTGSPDTGSPDTGSPDTGPAPGDTGDPPAETGDRDTASTDGPPEGKTCGCGASPGRRSTGVGLLALLGLLARRRRR